MSLSWSALHAQLLRSADRLSFHRQFEILRSRRQALEGFSSVHELLNVQHDPGGDPERKDRVLRALLTEARSETAQAETAHTLAMLALWPGLDALRGRLRRYMQSDPDLLVSELVGRLGLAITTIDLERVNRIAATLLLNLRRDILRDLKAAWNSPEDLCDVDAHAIPAAADRVSPDTALDRLQPVIGSDAALVVAVVIMGFTQREAAAALGISHEAARKRYQRAMSRLKGVVSDECPNPGSEPAFPSRGRGRRVRQQRTKAR